MPTSSAVQPGQSLYATRSGAAAGAGAAGTGAGAGASAGAGALFSTGAGLSPEQALPARTPNNVTHNPTDRSFVTCTLASDESSRALATSQQMSSGQFR